jgi:hypothetical protein
VKNRTPEKIVARVGWLLVVVGLAPYAWLVSWPLTHNLEALSIPLPLKRGEFVSPYFTTNSHDNYQIDLYWSSFPDPQTEVDLDWRILDENGTVIQQGTYKNQMGAANTVGLGTYRPGRKLRQRIVVNVHQDVQAPDAHPRLRIGQPDNSLDLAEGYYPLATLWAFVLAGSGLITLAVLRMRQWGREQKSSNGSEPEPRQNWKSS